MRRGPGGVGAINRQRLAREKYATKGTEIADIQLSQMGKQLDSFKTSLEDFAGKYKQEIKKNPEFRGHFQQMCARIGVDPLAYMMEYHQTEGKPRHFASTEETSSSHTTFAATCISASKGFWAELLGVGDFYYELGIQIVEICMATRSRNGGLMTMDELHKKILKTSKSRQDVSEDDLARAIKKLHVMGSGFQIIPVGTKQLVQSVPGELSMDHTAALQLAQGTGCTSVSSIMKDLGWDADRTKRVLDHMVHEEMAWVDNQAPNERLYWFPGLFPET